MDYELWIVNQFAAAFLQLIHQRVFFIRIQGFIKAAEFQQSVTARDEVAEDKLFFAGLPHLADGVIARATWSERPTREDQRENLFDRGGIGRTKVGSAQHFHIGSGKVNNGTAQIVRWRHGCIVEEINKFATNWF